MVRLGIKLGVKLSNPLDQYRILIADADLRLARVFRSMLGGMGFTNVEVTSSGEAALEGVEAGEFDFLITEQNTRHLDGISLIKQVRKPFSPCVAMPIIMLSGRADTKEVMRARDKGVNEYLLKPFAPKIVYDRIERIIETPREFVISERYTGPDRRASRASGQSEGERRRTKPVPQSKDVLSSGIIDPQIPIICTPDYSLKEKLPESQPLRSFVVSDMLGMDYPPLLKISEDIVTIDKLYQVIKAGGATAEVLGHFCDLCLRVKTSAHQFGHRLVSRSADGLYQFCKGHWRADNEAHHVVVEKHIEVLQTALNINPNNISIRQGNQVLMELQNLVIKLGLAPSKPARLLVG